MTPREQARKAGLTRFTDPRLPCYRCGGVVERMTSSGKCHPCKLEAKRRDRANAKAAKAGHQPVKKAAPAPKKAPAAPRKLPDFLEEVDPQSPRALAHQAGLKRYTDPSKPCEICGTFERTVIKDQCLACAAAETEAWMSRPRKTVAGVWLTPIEIYVAEEVFHRTMRFRFAQGMGQEWVEIVERHTRQNGRGWDPHEGLTRHGITNTDESSITITTTEEILHDYADYAVP
jgi:hypothetical protein